jgi:hypothetical protein
VLCRLCYCITHNSYNFWYEVYVPKDGATHTGTQLGIHFFHSDQVIAAAIERGDLIETCDETSGIDLMNSDAEQCDGQSTSRQLLGHRGCGNLTLTSARTAIDILDKFMREDNHDRFVGSFFSPLWSCLKNQGVDADEINLSWRDERYREKLSIRNWCFVPPSSKGVQGGRSGRDYFLTEEELVLSVLKEISALKELSSLCANHADSFEAIMPVLERAVDENLEYRDAKLGKRYACLSFSSNLCYPYDVHLI